MRSHVSSVRICRSHLGQENSKWEPGACCVRGLGLVVQYHGWEVSCPYVVAV